MADCQSAPELNGRRLADIARERGVHAVDLLLDLALAGKLDTKFRVPIVNFDEDEAEKILQDPNVVLGLGEGGAHLSQLCDACFSTHLLGRWVRERRALTLERAVHMLSARPAAVFGIRDRGLLALGRTADVAVFDPDSVGAGPLERVYDLPAGAGPADFEAARHGRGGGQWGGVARAFRILAGGRGIPRQVIAQWGCALNALPLTPALSPQAGRVSRTERHA